ncbi:DNA methyltransferase [Pseudonocardia cypriaca]|uniref:site-specific DNA-methyltransferase (adenine-specific) n=1 Tax=Pseudonocardia cypriaca TaxID=882449 RepID=A0A543GBB4_9PSEU|nr:DNA methyltransferase [Pseudonocardia cypriaca]TQM43377.1 hypothetical protein FB388_0722 [Pseudonocardia cypriaca]
MRALPAKDRKRLESAVLAARRVSESACRAAIDMLGVFADKRPDHLGSEQAALRNGLRARWRQLGLDRELLVAECAYEQWHRLLFARFLAENNLLLHPQYEAPVTLSDCEELAADLREPDAWAVAARFASEILPGIFRLADPCVRLRLAPEGRHALEEILDGLPAEMFAADDALGWVYQFWQKNKKDEVNASERKIGGADLGPVTQLFTENYMVRFLLENSLGAWWAARYPDSPLVKGFDYLRFADDGQPAAGSFEGWPERVAEVTVMDPCCGSGHFLVEAFSMLSQMRAEEEGLSVADSQDAVLCDNLYGLDIDPRCVQIAMFAVVLQAWKTGGGWRRLNTPNIACSGLPVKASINEWNELAGGDGRIEGALSRLHVLFRDADSLGSLIDPLRMTSIGAQRGSQQSLLEIDWSQLAPLLSAAMTLEGGENEASVLGTSALGIAAAAEYLSRSFTLIATNVPYSSRVSLTPQILGYIDSSHADAAGDLATTFLDRSMALGYTVAIVSPQNWLYQPWYKRFRQRLLQKASWRLLARLGAGAFKQISGEVVNVALIVVDNVRPSDSHLLGYVDVQEFGAADVKDGSLKSEQVSELLQGDMLNNPDARIARPAADATPLLAERADSAQGICTGDYARFGRNFWELDRINNGWARQQSTVSTPKAYGGREWVLLWQGGNGELQEHVRLRLGAGREGSWIRGIEFLERRGVVVSQSGDLKVTLYTGDLLDNNAAVIVPFDEELLPALWAYCSSPEYRLNVRNIDSALKVTNKTLLKVPFDEARWRKVANEVGPLPAPWSDDPTQWLFAGRPDQSTASLQVAVGRLLGYRWPDQAESDELDSFVDNDGIACIPAVAGEARASDRVQQLLATAYDSWSPATLKGILEQAGSKKPNLAEWLRDEFFKQHCALFGNRPFIWHIWDGLKDGFSALVNYHRLDRKTLAKLTYSYLGQDWVERLRAEIRDEVAGAEARLAAALELKRKLELILDGEQPYDIYVRWKAPHEQPMGWEPDLNDGVRLNIRPFVTAGVLRTPFNIHWKKDRGKDPDGSERLNDIHMSVAEKQEARKRAGLP